MTSLFLVNALFYLAVGFSIGVVLGVLHLLWTGIAKTKEEIREERNRR